MFSNLVSLINQTLTPSYTPRVEPKSNNPFSYAEESNNPFVGPNFKGGSASYAQNKPVAGGYFAGYYNGKPNIVGRKLFVEV